MADRYFVEPPIEGDAVRLTGAEAHHLLHVMRAKAGDCVVLFDGSGWEYLARVVGIGRNVAELKIASRHAVDRECHRHVTLAVALPKGERQRWLVEKAVELGVARLIPLVTERGVAESGDAAWQRLRRAAIEASKQCGRNRLLEIERPQRWAVVATSCKADLNWFATPDGAAAGFRLDDVALARSAIAAIGPEGGWTAMEVETARAAGWHDISLGPRILRVETAALAVAGLLTTVGKLNPHPKQPGVPGV